MSPIATKPPTSEIGQVTHSVLLPWSGFYLEETEHVPELMWPTSINTYTVMRNDAQVEALLRGATLPIRRYKWYVEPNGATDEVVEHVAGDLGLPIKGSTDPIGRRKRRFSFPEYIKHAMLALPYGHMFFEKVGEIEGDRFHLRKLAPRMPATISEINVEKDGGLRSIRQNITSGVTLRAPEIPVDRLVAFSWEREGGSWTGRSILRALYRNWLIKDRLLRIDAIIHERAGGVPYVNAPEGASAGQIKDLNEMAQRFKMGEAAGGALPFGSDLKFAGTRSPDVVGSIRFHNEEMARAFLMMFMQLGQTETGSRALGSEFIDYFQLAQEAIADWFLDVTNQHVIEDLVTWNFGEEVQAPILGYDRSDDPSLSVADLVSLIEAGAIQVDDALEEQLRADYRLPELDEALTRENRPEPPQLPPPSPPPADPAELRSRPVRAADASSPLMLPDRPLRRQPYAHEVLAAVDYATMDSEFTAAADALFGEITTLQSVQIAELHDAIAAAGGNLSKISAVSAQPVHAEVITARMQTMAANGAKAVQQEATRQGRTLPAVKLEAANARLEARAQATSNLLARSLSETAARKASNLSGGSMKPKAVAEATKAYLNGLVNNFLKERINGALMQGLNTGRKEAMGQSEPKSIYASELLDANTCSSCVERDGTEYADLDAAEMDYPTGGYAECEGGERCRGTLVAVFETEAEPTVDDS